MGVTYKLKKEVVDYILLQKRTNPRLGCRKIANLASQFFQKEISKSSVNAILKTFLLSSPVGRRAKTDKKQEKFKIPEHRKKELFVNVPKELLGDVSEGEDLLQESKKQQSFLGGLGVSILKAAEMQIDSKGFLSSLVDESSLAISEGLLYAPVLDVAKEDDLLCQETLWKISQLERKPVASNVSTAIKKIKELEKKKQEVKLKAAEAFSEVKYFSFSLENGSNFCIDAQFNSVWTKENVHSNFSLPLEKSLDFLSKKIITNIQPITLRCAPGVESFPSYFYEMLACFEGLSSRKIKKVDLISDSDEVLSSFETVLHKKRHFVCFLPSSHALFAQALDKKGVTVEKTFQPGEQSVLYSESDISVEHPFVDKEVLLRAFILKIEEQEPFALITNIPKIRQDSQEVISQYFTVWPNTIVGYQDFMMAKEETPVQKKKEISFLDEERERKEMILFLGEQNVFIYDFLFYLHQYCQGHFFPPKCNHFSFQQAKDVFYSLCGNTVEKDGILKVFLSLPENYSYLKELQYILRRANECGDVSNQKKRIFFIIT